MQRISCGFILLLLLQLISCEKDPVMVTTDPGGGGSMEMPDTNTMVVDTTIISGEEKYLTLDSDYIFDQEKLPTFFLELENSDLNFLDNDPVAEEYVPAILIFEGDTISPVGLRYKGSIGAYVNCLSGNNWADPSGFKTCTKLSMKVKINWEGRTEKFYGLKKLQFHSMNLDDSQMRDRLGYWMFREMGVPAPRCIHARLVINGTYVGIFSLVEQIDGRFTRYNWDDGEGNLYKELWPVDDKGEPHKVNTYISALRTNEDEDPSVDIIRNFGSEIANSEPSEIPTVIEQHMDINEIISYCVVDRSIRHDDGPFHWYCGGGSCSSHNFYWYEEPESRQLHLIAWDLDNAFENITAPNPVTNVPSAWDETRNNCDPFSSGAFGLQQKSAACDPIFGGLATYQDEYADIKQIFIEGPLSISNADSKIDLWAAQIRSATLEAATMHNDAISLNRWQSKMQELKNQLAIARTR